MLQSDTSAYILYVPYAIATHPYQQRCAFGSGSGASADSTRIGGLLIYMLAASKTVSNFDEDEEEDGDEDDAVINNEL